MNCSNIHDSHLGGCQGDRESGGGGVGGGLSHSLGGGTRGAARGAGAGGGSSGGGGNLLLKSLGLCRCDAVSRHMVYPADFVSQGRNMSAGWWWTGQGVGYGRRAVTLK